MRKEILRDDPLVGSDLFPRGAIEKGDFEKALLDHNAQEETRQDKGTVCAHADVYKQKEQEPAVVLGTDSIVDPSAKVIETSHVLVVLVAIKLASRDLAYLSSRARLVGDKEQIVVRVLVIEVNVARCDNARTGVRCVSPAEETRREDKVADDGVGVRDVGLTQDPRVDVEEDDTPGTKDYRTVDQKQNSIRKEAND